MAVTRSGRFFYYMPIACSGKGIKRGPDNLNSALYTALEYINGNDGAPNATAQIAIASAKKEAEDVISKINALFEGQWKGYREKAEGVRFSLFKEVNKF